MTLKAFALYADSPQTENTASILPLSFKNQNYTNLKIVTLTGSINEIGIEYEDGDVITIQENFEDIDLVNKPMHNISLYTEAETVIKVGLYRGETLIVSECISESSRTYVTEVKYKIDLQAANANVNVWDESVGAVTALSWQTGLPLERNQAGIVHKRSTFSSDFTMVGTSGQRELEDGANTTSIVIQAGANPLVIWLANFKLTKDNGQVIDFTPTAGRNSVVTIL